MNAVVSHNRKYLMSGALIAVVAVSAYGLGRVYPPLGLSEGTIAPAERYVSSQVGAGDVTLGDTSVPQLMQTDAFELMTKDPSFAQMVRDPAVAKDPNMFAQMAKQANAVSAAGREAQLQSAQLLGAMAQNAQAFTILGK